MNGFNGSGHADFVDLPRVLGPVVVAHGQGMVALVYGAGMAAEAAKVLAGLRDPKALHALSVLIGTFNQASSAYCRLMGWTEEQLGQCNRDIELAFAGAVVGAQGPKIVLAS